MKKLMIKYLLLIVLVITPLKADDWKIAGYMPVPVSGGKAFVKDSLIYILGGYSDQILNYTNLIQVFDPATGQWSIADTMKFARYGFIADNFNGDVIYCGGLVPQFGFHSALEVYNYDNAPFIHSSHTVFKRSYAAGIINGEKLYIAGGYSLEPGQPLVVEYNLPNSSIEYALQGPMPVNEFPLDQAPAFYNNEIYLFGGSHNSVSNKIMKYSITDKTLTISANSMSTVRAAAGIVEVFANKFLLIGGYNETDAAIKTTEWVEISESGILSIPAKDLNIERTDAIPVKFGNKIYVFGGTNKNGMLVNAIETISVDNITSVEEETQTNAPVSFILGNNYPNPFNNRTAIDISIPQDSDVSLTIFSIFGEKVTTLYSGNLSKGNHSFSWNGKDDSGRDVASGTYIYKLSSGNFNSVKKMTFLK